MAQPLSIIGTLPSVSQFQFSHWTVLVCHKTWTPLDIRDLLLDLNDDPKQRDDDLGFLFHLFRLEGGKSISLSSGLEVREPFTTSQLVKNFSTCVIAYAGTTELAKEEIVLRGNKPPIILAYMIGNKIHEAHPDYRVWTNNCQNWAKYLVEEITGERNCPRTVSDMIRFGRGL